MSSFFTLPSSAKKRKRRDHSTGSSDATKKAPRQISERTSHGARGSKAAPRDESISGSDSETPDSVRDASDGGSESESSNEGETGAERRLRLAERYLKNVRSEVQQGGFDAEEIDKDLIAERLKKDVAESKGRMYRYVAQSYDYSRHAHAYFRGKFDSVTGVAACPPYAYTVSKDIQLIKWELPPPPKSNRRGTKLKQPPHRQRPIRLTSTRGTRSHSAGSKSQQVSNRIHHSAPILCVAASSDGRFVASGGQDKKLIIWSAADLTPLRIFSQHRDIITSLSIENSINRLYTASYDRTIKTWGLGDQAYIETLFGHQDHIVDISALSHERCLSAGARDRTVRLWKVIDESQLVFRGGRSGGDHGASSKKVTQSFAEGSIERVTMIDDETFVTGSDNGSLSLWSAHKKKPVFTYACAHGLDPPLKLEEAFAETVLEGRTPPAPPQPRWITALTALPYSDIILSGSWDGSIRAWQVSEDKRRIEPIGVLNSYATPAFHEPPTREDKGTLTAVNGVKTQDTTARGIVNEIAIFERGERGGEGLCVLAALGRSHRLGRWLGKADGKDGAIVFEIPPMLFSKKRLRAKKRTSVRSNGSVKGSKTEAL